ncbi:MAG: hypothetical protein C0485_18040 [Pirellula sp.]|nr:hypothetical protein [Pirellula sp.]
MSEASNNDAELIDELLNAGSALIDRGLHIIPCSGKTPCDDWGHSAREWQTLPITRERLERGVRAAKEPAIGIILGPRSGIIDIETDSAAEVAAVNHLWEGVDRPVAPTYRSKRGHHQFYRWDERLAALGRAVFEYKDPQGNSVKIRLGGVGAAQSILPPTPGRQWLPNLSLDDVDPPPLPEEVIERLLAASQKKQSTPLEASTPVQQQSDRGVRFDTVAAMERSTEGMEDGADGSKRLFTCACRCVEANLSDESAVASIRAYAQERPFPKAWSDAEILERVRDAERTTTRGREDTRTAPLTDLGNGRRFARLYGQTVRYVHNWGKWLVWDGTRWRLDDRGVVMSLAKEIPRHILDEARRLTTPDELSAHMKWAKASQSLRRFEATLALAESEPPIAIGPELLDTQPWQFNCANGTVDLRTGQLRPHDPNDLLTKCTNVAYPTDSSVIPHRWLAFLDTTFGGDRALISYVQGLMGVALFGKQREHLLPVFYGGGANGKSVFTTTVQAAMGEYAHTAPHGFLMTRRNDEHPTALADLFGKRLVIIAETKDGQRLDEGLVKSVTGGDRIRARRMREDHWEFIPSHLAILVSNHKPVISGTDKGIWRRLRLIPFNVTIPEEEQDRELSDKLQAELPGILQWMVDGCLQWQASDLHEPPSVTDATAEYQVESDTFASWFAELVVRDNSKELTAAAAYSSYTSWCEANGDHPISKKSLGQRIMENGIGKRKSNGIRYVGITLAGGVDPEM